MNNNLWQAVSVALSLRLMKELRLVKDMSAIDAGEIVSPGLLERLISSGNATASGVAVAMAISYAFIAFFLIKKICTWKEEMSDMKDAYLAGQLRSQEQFERTLERVLDKTLSDFKTALAEQAQTNRAILEAQEERFRLVLETSQRQFDQQQISILRNNEETAKLARAVDTLGVRVNTMCDMLMARKPINAEGGNSGE